VRCGKVMKGRKAFVKVGGRVRIASVQAVYLLLK